MTSCKEKSVNVIGGGLAGCEAAWVCANNGLQVNLYEMRPKKLTPAHQTEKLAELVCSNSFRSDDDENNAVGLLHHELRQSQSLIMDCADRSKVAAGSALAVDRNLFADAVSAKIEAHDNITVIRDECNTIPTDYPTIIATGPLTSDSLGKEVAKLTGKEALAFYDAIAPIIYEESIDHSIAWRQSRYDKGDADYLNLPMDKLTYEQFIDDLLSAECKEAKSFENTPHFEGCLPIEVMAQRGRETLRFGPLKPIGLTNAHDQSSCYAVVQLRMENAFGSLWNMVGFQTKMTYSEQQRVFRKIPGLSEAKFARLGGVHRNTFIDSPRLLSKTLSLNNNPNIRFAGQITGVEGYVESAAIGHLAGLFTVWEQLDQNMNFPPLETAIGALWHHITTPFGDNFQPMNVNFGLFPTLSSVGKKQRKQAYCHRAKQQFMIWKNEGIDTDVA